MAAAALAAALIALFSALAPFPSQASQRRHPGHHGASPSAAARPSGPAAGVTGPALSIGVDDGRRTAKPGDVLTYTVKIHNIGTKSAPGLDVVQTLPAGLTLISATPHGVAHAGQVRWQVNLAAGRADTFGVVGRVGQTPRQLLRLATIACASTGGSVKPIVCAAHSDELPAGAVVAHLRHAPAGPGGHTPGYLLFAGAAVGLCAAAVGARQMLRRRRPRPAS